MFCVIARVPAKIRRLSRSFRLRRSRKTRRKCEAPFPLYSFRLLILHFAAGLLKTAPGGRSSDFPATPTRSRTPKLGVRARRFRADYLPSRTREPSESGKDVIPPPELVSVPRGSAGSLHPRRRKERKLPLGEPCRRGGPLRYRPA